MQLPGEKRVWVCPENDLESVEIVRLLTAQGETVLRTGQAWGARWDRLERSVVAEMERLKQEGGTRIYGIELAGPNGFDAVNIDHHRYSDEDRYRTDSSLEQVGKLLDVELSRRQRLIAVNDRAYIDGMIGEERATLEEVMEIRRADRLAQGLTASDEEQARKDVAQAEWREGRALVHCPAGGTSAHSDLLWGKAHETLLTGSRWSYSGPRVQAFVDAGFLEPHWSGGVGVRGYFGISEPSGCTQEVMLKLFWDGASTAYRASTGTRVNDFHAILLCPLRVISGGRLREESRSNAQKGSNEWLAAYAKWICTQPENRWEIVEDYYSNPGRRTAVPEWQRYGEYLYLQTYIQKIFHGKHKPDQVRPVAILQRRDIESAKIRLRADRPEWECTVERVNLFLFPTDVAIAAVEFCQPRPAGDDLMADAFTLADALDFLDYVRRLYPPYIWQDEQTKELHPGGIPVSIRWAKSDSEGTTVQDCLDSVRARCTPIGEHWRELFAPLRAEGDEERKGELFYGQVEDDRMAVLAAISVDSPERISDGDWTRLAFCDDRGDSGRMPYSRCFLRGFVEDNCYDRFWDPEAGMTTRYLCTAYSFVAVGRDADGKFRKTVLPHMQQHYFLLLVLAHMQKATLLGYWKRLADMVHTFENAAASEASRRVLYSDQKWLLQDLTDFVSRFYFSEVSNQLQALELFDWIGRHLRIKQTFEEVVQQSEFVRKVLLEEREEAMTEAQRRMSATQTNLSAAQLDLAWIATRLAPAAVAVSVVALAFSTSMVQDAEKAWIAQFPAKIVYANWLIVFLMMVFWTGVIWIGLHWWIGRGKWGRAGKNNG